MTRRTVPLVLVLLAAVAAWRSVVVVDPTEVAVHLRLGEPIRVIVEPGLYTTWPIDSVVRLDRRLQVLQSPRDGDASREYLTGDDGDGIGKNVVATTATSWRVGATPDAVRTFFETMGDLDAARARLDDIVVSEFAATLARTPFASLVGASSDDWDGFLDGVRARCAERVGARYGLEIVDLRIEHLSFPERNRGDVFERMRAERETIAAGHRADGEREAATIRAQAERQRDEILAAAHEDAARVLAAADAEAARIHAEAYARDPEFFEFLRTLEAYETALDEGTVAVLSQDAGFLELFREALARDVDDADDELPRDDEPRNDGP